MKISRDDVSSFEDLITKARHVERMAQEQSRINPTAKASFRNETQSFTTDAAPSGTISFDGSANKKATGKGRSR